MMEKRLNVIYSGTVQGVGFRFTAERIAWSLNLNGWVMNLADGGVQVVAEGKEEDLITFVDKIKKTLGLYIRGTKVSWQEATGEFDNFTIRFH